MSFPSREREYSILYTNYYCASYRLWGDASLNAFNEKSLINFALPPRDQRHIIIIHFDSLLSIVRHVIIYY